MMVKLQLLIFILVSTTIFAKTPQILQDITNKEHELYLKKLKKYKKIRDYTFAEKEALKVQREDIIKSRTHLIAIKQRSVLVNIKTEELFSNSKEIISRAFTLQDYEGYFYLISKGNKVKFKVKAKDTSNLKNITSMYEAPKYFEPERKKIDYNLTDSKFYFDYDLSLNLGLAQSEFINEIASTEEHTSSFIAYELDLIGNWNFPIRSGVSLQYEKQYARELEIEYNTNSLLLGGVFEYRSSYSLIKELTIGMKFYIDIVSRLNISDTSSSQRIKLSKNVVSMFISKPFYKFKENELMWSIGYTNQWIKAKADSSLYELSSSSNKNSIIFISLKLRGHYL